jgi:excisionase family DNA binding protein
MRHPRYAHPIPDAAGILGIKQSKLYELIASHQIRAKKIGSRTVVLDDSLREFLESQPDAQITYTKT